MLMNGLNTSLCEEGITYRRLEDFNKKHSNSNLGLLEFTLEGLRVKFKLCRNEDLGRLRHYLVVVGILAGGL